MKQFSPKEKRGEKPTLLIGNMHTAYQQAKSVVLDSPLLVLAYRKDNPNQLKYGVEDVDSDELKLSLLFEDDDRGRKLYYVIQSIEYGKEGRFKEAISSMLKAYRKEKEFTDRDSLKNLQRLINNYSTIQSLSLLEFYNKFLFVFFILRKK